jgi:hypothetical protein
MAKLTFVVGGVYGGVAAMSYLVVDAALGCIIGDSPLARTLRVAAAILASIAIATAATTAILGIQMTFATGVVISLAMAVAQLVIPLLLPCVLPCLPVLIIAGVATLV